MTDTARVVYQFRVKDKHSVRLRSQAAAANIVWNYCNETQQKAVRSGRKWLSGYDLWKLVAGATKEGLDLHSHSAMCVCKQYYQSRTQNKRPWLRWRTRKSLGWVPFNTGHMKPRDGGFVFNGERYEVWMHRPLPSEGKIGSGCFSQDSRGRWYLNILVSIEESAPAHGGEVGIDLGLKDFAALSDGTKWRMPGFFRRAETSIGSAQRAHKKRAVRALRVKVKNQRKDFLHKVSNQIAKQNGLIVVGNVSSSTIAKTSMAKSVLDAGWSGFRKMLAYKAIRHGGTFLEVSEAYTTQTCSSCGSLPPERPRGIAGLGIREWACGVCGTVHDRDVNAACNILRLGKQTLAEGAAR